MKELKELENRINEMKKTIEELEEKNNKLEYELFMYDSDYKSELSQKLNEFENLFLNFIDQKQNDCLLNDYDICNIYLSKGIEVLFDEFTEHFRGHICESNIKKYYNYSRHTN